MCALYSEEDISNSGSFLSIAQEEKSKENKVNQTQPVPVEKEEVKKEEIRPSLLEALASYYSPSTTPAKDVPKVQADQPTESSIPDLQEAPVEATTAVAEPEPIAEEAVAETIAEPSGEAAETPP